MGVRQTLRKLYKVCAFVDLHVLLGLDGKAGSSAVACHVLLRRPLRTSSAGCMLHRDDA